MPLSIFSEALRRNWRGMIFWSLGLWLLGLGMMLIIPNISFLKQIEALLNTMPAVVKALGMDDAAQMATPEGVISGGYFGRVILIAAIYAVLSGLNVSANEEDQGILDVVLSLPLPRWRLILEKFAAYILMSMVIVFMGFVGLWMGSLPSTIRVDMGKLVIGSLNILPSLWLMMAFSTWAGAFFRRKNQAVGATTFFILASYVLDFAGSAASESSIARLRAFSFFAYYDNAHVMQTGLNAANVFLLLGLTLVFMMASVWYFQRRDIGG